MAMSKLPILKPVTTGYRESWLAIRMMPVLAGFAFLIIAVNMMEYIIPAGVAEDAVLANLVSFAVTAAQSFFVTPIMIAVHRFVILGEVTTSYVLEPNQRVFRAFFGWLLALSVIGLFAVMLFAPNALPASLSLAIVLIVMVLMIVVTLRLSILFPAIAVETPGATARNAWADSKQHTFSIFLIFLLAIVPLVIGALFVLFPFVLGDDGQGAALGLPAMIIMSVVQMFATILCVAIASRLYQALADRLLRAT
jgi:hypothetical protein